MAWENRPRFGKLAIVAALLGLVAVIGFASVRPWNQMPGLVAWIAVILLLELPGVWLRLRGGSPLLAFLASAALPLVILEGYLYLSWLEYRDRGGDLQDVELYLMVAVLPVVLASSAIVILIASLAATRRGEQPE